MINVFLNQMEKDLDSLIANQKDAHDKLRVRQDIYIAIEASEDHAALKIVILYSILKYKSELHSLNTRIDAANNAIKELHQLRHKDKDEIVYERSEPEAQD